MTHNQRPRKQRFLILLLMTMLAVSAGYSVQLVRAQNRSPDAEPQAGSLLHPTFALLDADGENVLTSSQPVSTMTTCGQCHDTVYITAHSFHADLGISTYQENGELDSSNGLFGKWDPLTYRYLSQSQDERLDLSTPEWLMSSGLRHVGGGPAETSREGQPLTSLPADANNPETSLLTPNGSRSPWDWKASGTVEMNCFLCHMANPDNASRQAALEKGQFGWANTATLLDSNIVRLQDGQFVWNPEAFDENGALRREYVFVQDPTNDNCALCHGVADNHNDTLNITNFSLNNSQTATTGQVISPQRIAESGMNIAGKDALTRSWDVHAERQLECTDCHFSLNNPAYALKDDEPAHLSFDPRRLDVGEYLQRPDHNFARGQSAQYSVAPELKGTMRRCEACHDAAVSHSAWLPYLERHMETLACEACHIPRLFAPAIEQFDWTVLTPDGQPAKIYRGVQEARHVNDNVNNLISGYQPVLLMRANINGDTLLAPYNIITTWYWVYDDSEGNTRPVREIDLKAAWFKDGAYAPEVLTTFDTNHDSVLDEVELKIDNDAKRDLIARRLSALGLDNVRIAGRMQPYSINHNVTRGEWAVNECTACHSEDSRLTASIQLAAYVPGGVMPTFVESNVAYHGSLNIDDDGALHFTPDPRAEGLYIFGSSRLAWLDWLGALFFVGTLLGVAGHGTLRYINARKQAHPDIRLKKVYMYSGYERFWHWLQMIAIVTLLLTGLVIHRPDMFGAFNFRYMVAVHNVLAAILVTNAALSLFYHLVSGEIKRYIPRPRGFFDQAIVQARFYLKGIFKGEAHPFEKTPEKKFNPLQQITYFGLLNILLPLQVITGILMWGAQKWPQGAEALGSLPWLGPFHSLVAWMLGAFIVAHVYLTTTGPTVFTALKAMIDGWEEIEVTHDNEEQTH